MFWISTAYAMGAGGQEMEQGLGSALLPFVLIFIVFYFLLIRPQNKRAKEHREMVNSLRKGDEVVTTGGLCGRIAETQEQTVIVDFGDTKVTVLRSAIASVTSAQPKGQDKKGKKDAKSSEDSSGKNADGAGK